MQATKRTKPYRDCIWLLYHVLVWQGNLYKLTKCICIATQISLCYFSVCLQQPLNVHRDFICTKHVRLHPHPDVVTWKDRYPEWYAIWLWVWWTTIMWIVFITLLNLVVAIFSLFCSSLVFLYLSLIWVRSMFFISLFG
jgi:hypothetical protein